MCVVCVLFINKQRNQHQTQLGRKTIACKCIWLFVVYLTKAHDSPAHALVGGGGGGGRLGGHTDRSGRHQNGTVAFLVKISR